MLCNTSKTLVNVSDWFLSVVIDEDVVLFLQLSSNRQWPDLLL